MEIEHLEIYFDQEKNKQTCFVQTFAMENKLSRRNRAKTFPSNSAREKCVGGGRSGEETHTHKTNLHNYTDNRNSCECWNVYYY